MTKMTVPAWKIGLCGIVALLLGGDLARLTAGPLGEAFAESSPGTSEIAESLRQAGRHLAAISAKTMPSVVNIESTRDSRTGEVQETGSGVIMRSPRTKGVFVITNRHVVADSRLNQIEVHLADGRVLTPTEKLEDADSDLAVLRVPEAGVEAAQFGDSDNLDIGHFVLAMGSPFGLSESVTLGIISAKGRRSLELPGRKVINQDFLQTDAAINPGNSGGPLIDLDGRVVGINTAIASQGGGNEGIGFSIPSNLVQFIVGQLLDYGRVRRGYLGVQLDEHFDFEVARKYALDRKQGARVTKVIDKTPAAIAGIRPDDIILNFDGFDVADETDLINKVNVTPVNKRVRVIVLRTGQRMTLQVVLSEKPEGERSEAPALPVELKAPYRNTSLAVMRLSPTLAVQCGYGKEQSGLLVKQAAAEAGADELQLYDVIEEVARQPVTTLEELDTALATLPDQSPVLLKVRRVVDGTVQTLLIEWNRE
ncbi:trypsin-like peptidase domain-containing protein [Planctomicrobium piriforme]|uniref:Serine protease Do n=1 Tax=Planctomicrobium piriforme TaxID=1576369 RepID=A0A1I3Q9T1_9PLAN|nr:trypsin-like peptidase domain-containing protein [Planctomicrobium piriforme]SFJ30369.1 serine protease Do [Planctomicrobium piriforme]